MNQNPSKIRELMGDLFVLLLAFGGLGLLWFNLIDDPYGATFLRVLFLTPIMLYLTYRFALKWKRLGRNSGYSGGIDSNAPDFEQASDGNAEKPPGDERTQ